MYTLELLLDWLHPYKSVVMVFPFAKLFADKVFLSQDWSGYVCKVHVIGVPNLRVGYILRNIDISLGVNQKEGLCVKHRA